MVRVESKSAALTSQPKDFAMATIIGDQELLKRALEFISDKRKEKPHADLQGVVDEAAMRFNLSPKDADSLVRILGETPD